MSFNLNNGIPESDLPVKSPSGASLLRYVENGKSYSGALSDVTGPIDDRINVLEISQGDGVPGVANYADIATLFPSPTAGQQVDVLTDSDPAKVGRWGYIGGAWVKSADRVSQISADALAWTHPAYPVEYLTEVGYFIDRATGARTASASFRCSPMLRVMPNTEYSLTARTAGSAGHAWYRRDGSFISGFGASQNGTINATSPADAFYVRLTQQIAGGPYPFWFRTSSADIDIDRLREVLTLHIPQVSSEAVIFDGSPLDRSLVSLNVDALDSAASRARVIDTLKLMSVESSFRRVFGARCVAIGDSTMRGTYNGDSAAGVGGSAVDSAADSWFTHMCLASGQAVTRVANVGVIGATVQDLAANFSSTVISRNPDSVIISGGTNNAALVPQTTPAAYRAVIEGMINDAIDAGITPILSSVLPSNNSPVYTVIPSYNDELKSLATQYGLFYIDLYSFALDPVTGGLKAEYSGDGVHPSAEGQAAMGVHAASLIRRRPIGDPPLPAKMANDQRNLIVNPLFAGPALTAGNAPNWLVNGSIPSGVTASLVTRAGVIGNLQRIQAAGSTVDATILQSVSSAKYNTGDVLEITGRFFSTGTARKGIYLQFGGVPGQRYAIRTQVDASGVFYLRQEVPSGATGLTVAIVVMGATGGASGAIEVGQLSLRNLTTEGVA